MGNLGPYISGIMGIRVTILLGIWEPLYITAGKRYPNSNQFMAGIAYHFHKNQHVRM